MTAVSLSMTPLRHARFIRGLLQEIVVTPERLVDLPRHLAKRGCGTSAVPLHHSLVQSLQAPGASLPWLAADRREPAMATSGG